MKVEIKNVMILNIIEYLHELSLVRKHSRVRRDLIEKLSERHKKNEKTRISIAEEHCKKDSTGKPLIVDKSYNIPDENLEKYKDDIDEFNNELLVIDGGDNREIIRTMKTILRKFEETEYSGKQSITYDYLCNAFKIDENDEEEADNEQ